MFDFLQVCQQIKKGIIEIYPKFIIRKSRDLMIRGGDFYAIWDEEIGLWSTDEDDATRLIDKELQLYFSEHKDSFDSPARVLRLSDGDTGMIDKWHKYVQKQLRDNYHQLDEKIIFANTSLKKEDYASKKLSYPLVEGECKAYDEIMETLYSPSERRKLEWAVGSIISGDSKKIQKFIVMYGSAGTGKSTFLNIVQDLFDGYYSTFDAKALGSSNNAFALEPFKGNPLVSIQHDGDLSKIEDNTRLNSLVSHELMTINEKFAKLYSAHINAFLFMGTNKPVKITDAKSGLLRRLIDVSPTGDTIPIRRYKELTKQVKFELGQIAYKCLKVYEEDPGYFDDYIPIGMLGASNDFYNFIEDNYDIFIASNGITLKSAWESYKVYCEDAKVLYPYSQRVFKEELKNYYKAFYDRTVLDDGTRVRNYFEGFIKDKFVYKSPSVKEENWIIFKKQKSVFDKICFDCKAQYASDEEKPIKKWDEVETFLKDLDTSKLHFVRVPKNHIVIDFDLKDETGKKSYDLNIKEASKWPKTYAELSKSGQGIHLHYIYEGDVSRLKRLYSKDIEVKVFSGKSSLRRMLTKCNNLPIASISSGLPLKEEKPMVNFETVKSERGLRNKLRKCLNKEHHGSTKPEVDFIYKILEDAYESDLKYDVTDLRPSILSFAANSTNQSDYCIKLVGKMHFASEATSDNEKAVNTQIIFFDVEVFKNLFVVVWKAENGPATKMINPTPEQIEEILHFRLVGFNNRRYDNHILYARLMGYTNEQLFELSQRIINGSKNAMFGEAYNLSYTDVYDFSSKKQSLKKWEIELGIHHQELGLKWDEPVDESMWEIVADYCVNDVKATEEVFKALKSDFVAREILADIAGLSVNDTTNTLTTTIIFGKEKNPQSQFVYTDLSEMFPGYKFESGKSTYRGEETGEGGYVYSEPGMYTNVALLDIASMHPTSIEQLNLFGPFTERFSEIKQARILIKHKDYISAGKMFGGKLKPYLESDENAEALAYALKIAINSVYGLTSAKFDNKCRDQRNVDNIVAKRGALFMIDLKHAVQEKGFTVAHIKTDSIKIPDATPEIIDFVTEFGKRYGYIFEHEATYERMCLVNDAVYIAKYKDGKHAGEWTATGTQFQVPYVFKSLFSHEPIVFADLCETKTVTTSLYLDMNENLPQLSRDEERLLSDIDRAWHSDNIEDLQKLSFKIQKSYEEIGQIYSDLCDKEQKSHNYIFVGKAGLFCPIKPGCGGGILLREKDGSYYAATGTKGYRWMESENVKVLGKENDIDLSYYEHLVEEASISISEYGDFEWFVS